MKRTLSGLALALSASAALAGTPPAPSSARTETVELAVEGLNCALCSEAMKAQMKKLVGARDIEPRLECGRIYLEVEQGTKVTEGALSFLLMSNGFNLKGIKPAQKSMQQVRGTPVEAC